MSRSAHSAMIRQADARDAALGIERFTIDGRAPRVSGTDRRLAELELLAETAPARAEAARARRAAADAATVAQFEATVCASFQGNGQRCGECRVRRAMH